MLHMSTAGRATSQDPLFRQCHQPGEIVITTDSQIVADGFHDIRPGLLNARHDEERTDSCCHRSNSAGNSSRIALPFIP